MNKFLWALVILGLCAGQINGMWFVGLISSAIGGVGNYMADTSKGGVPQQQYRAPRQEINIVPRDASNERR